MTARRFRPEDEAGMTLIELLVVSILGVVVLGIAGTLLVTTVRGEARTVERAASVPEARVMMEGLTRELREGYGVEVAEANRLILLTYVNRTSCGGQPASSSIECRVSYECAGGTCDRAEGSVGGGLGTPVEVVRGIAAEDVFSYTPSAADPTYVGVRLRIPSADGTDDDVTLEDGVALRNTVLGG